MQQAQLPPADELPLHAEPAPEPNRIVIALGVLTGGALSFAVLALAAHLLSVS